MQGSEDDLEALADSLEENVPPAPEMPPRSLSEPQRVSGRVDEIGRLKSQEEFLLRADRLLISDGARLVQFLPLFVIALYGLAQTFTDSNPQWSVSYTHIRAAASIGGRRRDWQTQVAGGVPTQGGQVTHQ